MENNKKLELLKRKKQLAAILASGSIALTSIAGCSKKVEETTTTVAPSETTVIETFIPTPTPTPVPEVKKTKATEEYMEHAKAVAEAMYELNKEYFDEKNFTAEDLENVYYVINGKYYDKDDNLIMEAPELYKSFAIIDEFIEPERVNEMLQKQADVEHRNLSYDEYMEEVNASVFYDYEKAPLSNFFDINEDNKDIRDFSNRYSEEMVKITENIKNCVSPEEHMIEFFGEIRSAQTGDITKYKNINNYLQETNTELGYGYVVADMYKAIPNYLNTIIDGEFVTVQDEEVRVGLNYDERQVLNLYYLGDLVMIDDLLYAKELEAELFQTMPLEVSCDKQEQIVTGFSYQPSKGNKKSL